MVLKMFAEAGMNSLARELEKDDENNRPDSIMRYNILLQTYANRGEAARAMQLLNDILDKGLAVPTVDTFNLTLDVWASSFREDRVEQSFHVLALMRELAPKLGTKENNIAPNIGSYTALLKCLLRANKTLDAGKKVVETFTEMKHEGVQFDHHIFLIAIQICLNYRDLESLDLVLDDVEKHNRIKHMTSYGLILNLLADFGSPETAERCERLLRHIKAKSAMQKGDFIVYNIVFKAHALSGASDAAERVWSLYEQMLDDRIETTDSTYSTLIGFFSSVKNRKWTEKAEDLLTKMRPTHAQYDSVIKSWLYLGDANQATCVFVRMVEQFIEDRDPKGSPLVSDYLVVTRALLESNELPLATQFVDKMQQLRDAKQLNCGPDLPCYKALVEAWKVSILPEKAAAIEKYTRIMKSTF
jgi:antitoxin component HigA of HigAB toxin-antitoxin module